MSGRCDDAWTRTLRALAVCALSFALVFVTLLVSLFVVSAAHAQSDPVNTTASRRTIEEATRESCEGVSVVVRRCVAQPETGNSDRADDPLTRSRARAKAAFDRRDRRARQAALGSNDDAANDDDSTGGTGAGGKAQRLAPVIVTGEAPEQPLTIEEIFQRALNPQVVSPSGTVTTYGADGTRVECIARCVGPMCCLTLRARPDPAHESNSIGR